MLRPRGDSLELFVEKKGALSLSSGTLAVILKATLDKGFSFRFAVKGFSMLPYIRTGDVVTVSPLSASATGLGKVVAFIHPDTAKLSIHRIVGSWKKAYLVKGDSVIKFDGLIPARNILGCVTNVERNGKKVLFGLGKARHPISLLSFLGIFCILFFIRRRILSFFK